jgi:hypothetical protein
MMSLQKVLEEKQAKYINNNLWDVFVRDHKDEIIKNSDVLYLNDELLDRYAYKLPHLLEDNGCPLHLHKLTVMINDLLSFTSLKDKTMLFIPRDAYITSLFSLFNNSLSLKQ